MQKSLFYFVLVFSLLFITAEAQDESEYQRLHREADIERQAMVADKLPMLESEAEEFWNLYSEYRIADRELDDQRVELLNYFEEGDGAFTDDLAKRIVMEALRIERQRQALKQKFIERISLVLPSLKVLRYYQIETKLDAVKRYYWTSVIPLAPVAE